MLLSLVRFLPVLYHPGFVGGGGGVGVDLVLLRGLLLLGLLQPVLLHVRPHLPHCGPPLHLGGQQLAEHLHGLGGELPPQRGHLLQLQGLELLIPLLLLLPLPLLLLLLLLLLYVAPVGELLVEVVGVCAAFPGEVAGEDAEDDHPERPGVQAGLHAEGGGPRHDVLLLHLLALPQGPGAQLGGHVGQSSCDVADHGAPLLG